MEKNSSTSLAALAFLGIALSVLAIYGSIWINDTADVMNKYDWAHGYGTSMKVGLEHCEKWCEKHWKGTKEQYKYHCQWLYKWDDYDEECSYADFKRWYKYAYDDRGRVKNPNNHLSCSAWLKKHKR